ncbi:hypothetical protein AnigIFM56816_010579 [Aspergillus niger]|nr:hypothetical protein AnigIFM56816_010579 [Aspergillus niger]
MSMRRMDRVSKRRRPLLQRLPPRSFSISDPNQILIDISEDIISNDSRSVQYAPAGSICETLNLYQTEPSYNGIKSWTREPAAGIVEPVRAPESGQYALLVRNIKCSSGHGRLEVELDSCAE